MAKQNRIGSFNDIANASIIIQYYSIQCRSTAMSEAKEDLEDAGDKMKSGAKKTGNKIEDADEDAKDKVE